MNPVNVDKDQYHCNCLIPEYDLLQWHIDYFIFEYLNLRFIHPPPLRGEGIIGMAFFTSGRIFIKLWSNIYLTETVCRTP